MNCVSYHEIKFVNMYIPVGLNISMPSATDSIIIQDTNCYLFRVNPKEKNYLLS